MNVDNTVPDYDTKQTILRTMDQRNKFCGYLTNAVISRELSRIPYANNIVQRIDDQHGGHYLIDELAPRHRNKLLRVSQYLLYNAARMKAISYSTRDDLLEHVREECNRLYLPRPTKGERHRVSRSCTYEVRRTFDDRGRFVGYLDSRTIERILKGKKGFSLELDNDCYFVTHEEGHLWMAGLLLEASISLLDSNDHVSRESDSHVRSMVNKALIAQRHEKRLYDQSKGSRARGLSRSTARQDLRINVDKSAIKPVYGDEQKSYSQSLKGFRAGRSIKSKNNERKKLSTITDTLSSVKTSGLTDVEIINSIVKDETISRLVTEALREHVSVEPIALKER